LVIIMTLSTCLSTANKKNAELEDNWSVSENNYKASNRKNLAYQLSLKQMELSMDSMDIKLNEFKRRNNLKDKKIQALMLVRDEVVVYDTVIFKDTIFKSGLSIDTTITDHWMTRRLILEYPNKISITDSIRNEKNISWSHRRETIDPPKKFCVARWFQPKHTVVEILIEDMNPNFNTKEFKYNTIIK